MFPKKSWNPEYNYADMVAQELNDIQKQLSYINSLENRLKGKDPNSEYYLDFEMLSRMKKDLGLPVNFKTWTEKREEERAAAAGWVWTEKYGGMSTEAYEQLKLIEAQLEKAKAAVKPTNTTATTTTTATAAPATTTATK